MFTWKDIEIYVSIIFKKVKAFFLSHSAREVLIFSFFFLVAFAFRWLQILDDKYQREIELPIEVSDIPEGVTVVSDIPKSIKVAVEDRGLVLFDLLQEKLLPIKLNLGTLEDNETGVTYFATSELQKKITSHFSTTTRILSFRPDTISLTYVRGEGKKVPVKASGKITPHPQYYISQLHCSPDSVIVYAPSHILDTITAIYTMPVLMQNITEGQKREVALRKYSNVKLSPSLVNLNVGVDLYSEKTLPVSIVGINFPPGKILRTFPPKVNLTFQVGLNAFRSIKPDDFLICVSYEQLMQLNDDRIPLVVKRAPEGVRHIRISPKSVEYLIEEGY